MLFREISHVVHPISSLTHFGLGIGIWTRVQKGIERASGLDDGGSLLPVWEAAPAHRCVRTAVFQT